MAREYSLEKTRKHRNYGSILMLVKQQPQNVFYIILGKFTRFGEVHDGEATYGLDGTRTRTWYYNYFSSPLTRFLERVIDLIS